MINWITAKEYEDITYKKCNGVARIAFNRPEVRNAFRPKTTAELYDAFYDAQEDTSIGVAQRLLGTMGLKLTCVERRRVQGKITRFYQMTDLNPNDRANIFARWLERDTALCDIPSIKEFTTGT
jgi:1,4-dihydroxy-2-naphthoyl-CoA synthase